MACRVGCNPHPVSAINRKAADMTGVAITGHGGRQVGTSFGSYLVPPGVTIYFFTKDAQLLNTEGSDHIMDKLCTAAPDMEAVKALAVETIGPFSTVPDYVCYGSSDFRDPTGVYRVGQAASSGLWMAIAPGTQKRLSDIIGGGSSGGVIASEVFWLCCRDAPHSTNNIAITPAFSLNTDDGKTLLMSGDVGAEPAGLLPSQVRATGRWM